ncbi:LytR/AlgR family response regulator transcription factor [Kordiimonas lacus]|uniref:LytTr DNA-binding domain-containing protein n=1 Tax=Kordiimonas lacus TaxID=637679 RepID=A0A1G7BFE4_9PROT|nr:LytTR family DNA-binding domain-containing protein [Kordiimonas lacus]SDE25769.1 LytTr DNA-binding domain-containing protein [Kordiimonas lacus]
MKRALQILLWLIAVTLPESAGAQPMVTADFTSFEACEAVPPGPGVEAGLADCRPISAGAIDPQGRLLWVKATVTVPDELLLSGAPLGLYISGKAASEVYFNGLLLGRNGIPGDSKSTETPGRMDAVMHLPDQMVLKGPNSLIFKMSGHHAIIDLVHPMHMIAVGPYADPRDRFMDRYLPALLPLGILLVGAVYFGLAAIRQKARWQSYLVPLVALFAAGQLMAEVSRGVFAYSYPFQDIRLMLVLGFAAASGACLLLHVIDRFVGERRITVAIGSFLLTGLIASSIPGFDGMSAAAILTPAIIGFILAVPAAFRKEPNALGYAIALWLFCLVLYVAPFWVMDTYLYYVVAALLLFLFVGEIQALTEARKRQQQEQARADRLALALEEAQQKQAPGSLSVTSAGVVEKIPHDKLVYCKGARDYVELITDGLGQKLHSASLTDLEGELPATFLRVHRSYIVNTAYIDRLEREPSGTGMLHLTTGDHVPVSRRIMPTVRKALG